jgi:hypothetical protein
VLIKGDLPLMALPFRNTIESTIKQKAEAPFFAVITLAGPYYIKKK